VELDAKASAAHAVNFPSSVHIRKDISHLSGRELARLAGVGADEIVGVVGGPPCQGFSDIGLRSIHDPRNELLCDFFRLVAEMEPAFFLAENVPGALSERNAPLLNRALATIPNRYTLIKPFVVKASDYGAPTIRTRVFFYGFDPERCNPLTAENFLPQGAADVRVQDALAGLPAIRSTWQKEHQGWRGVGELGKSSFSDRITSRVPAGVGNPDALSRLRRKGEVSGFLGTIHSKKTVRRFKKLGPGESDSISKCVRLDPAGYCPTLRAGTGPEHGSYQAIRPVHPRSPRVISPREGARLQGFPDWFQFDATKWHSFRQIGNSVSPIVAEILLSTIKRSLA
jgi:DNA (cytosine-5)-methyltransferase 1